jgi:hypothetical protein
LKKGAGMPRYRVTLTEEEREELESITKKGNTTARKYKFARALILCDESGDRKPWEVIHVAEALGITSRTIEHLKERFVTGGLPFALERKERETPPREIKFDGRFEAHIISLACSDPPEGRVRWTVRLLADKAVELEYAPTVSHMSVQRILKKNNLSLT